MRLCVEHKFWSTRFIILVVLGISPGTLQLDVEHKLWSIGSLAIVSLGVLYKCILVLVLSKRL